MNWLKTLIKGLMVKTLPSNVVRKARCFYTSRQVLNNEGHRERELGIVHAFLREGDMVADIGASVGVYTKEFSTLVGGTGKVYAFEPLMENFDILKNVTQKGNLSNVRLFQVALGSKHEQRDIVIPDLDGFNGYYWAHLARPNESGRRETTEVFTLDELWDAKKIHGVDFVKCDVEGGELEVIKGAQRLLKAQHPALLFEVSLKTSERIFHDLHSLGYRAFVYGEGLIETETFRDGEYANHFFVHPNSKIWGRVQPLMSMPLEK